MVTCNNYKYNEASNILREYNIEIIQIKKKRIEIQSDDIANIAVFSLDNFKDDSRPIVVEDAGIFIDYYNGFPGPYSSYVRQTIGIDGILKLMNGIEKRNASYKSVVAYRNGHEKRCFKGTIKGQIAQSKRGTQGFGCDPIFIPNEGDGRTFGEMTEEEKNALSHRARAFRGFGEWFARRE